MCAEQLRHFLAAITQHTANAFAEYLVVSVLPVPAATAEALSRVI